MAGSGGGAFVQWGRAQSRERHRNEQRERRKRAGLISLSPPLLPRLPQPHCHPQLQCLVPQKPPLLFFPSL